MFADFHVDFVDTPIVGVGNDNIYTSWAAENAGEGAPPGRLFFYADALLTAEPDCDEHRIREALSGNLCRCTGYIGIVEAVLEARAAYKKRGRGGTP